MASKDPSIINDILCLSPPWNGALSFYSVHQRFLGFTIDYKSPFLICPLCGEECDVIGKRIVNWRSPDFLGFETSMTANLPVVGYHNFNCKMNHEQELVSNTLLLDLIVRQMGFIECSNPFVQLFSAKEITFSH